MAITCSDKNMLQKILVSEKELSDMNFERLKITEIHIQLLISF